MPVTRRSTSKRRATAKVFWTGRSQAVRLPKEFRFETQTVLIRREGSRVVLEPDQGWPEGYFESFTGISDDFQRPPQGVQRRAALKKLFR